ncbi:HlyD family efflux transporter periplasmic adaptor subunit [Kamptonema formosum]|uniref:HlyD family efflux transporter periplasmic adaptor subunit n=1 Tax=Kamptonema formosum TaxID=331992 RepID=UPI000344EAAD|nr:HlyD family efflux transporter periplasmic adaptor subunit [Oscillatoria sp. PCC 10802]
MKDKRFLKPGGWWLIGVVGAAGIAVTGVAYYQLSQMSAPKPPAPAPAPPPAVSALGRLEPQGEVIKLSAPNSQEGARVKAMLVREGAAVRAGQVLAVLDSQDQRSASLQQAEKQVKAAKARLAQVEAGAKAGEIAAQKATISRLQAQLQGQKQTQEATIARLVAQLQGEQQAQEATVARAIAQLQGDRTAQKARIARLTAQLQEEKIAQEAAIERIKAEQQGQISAQKAAVARLEAEVKNARSEFERYEQLYKAGAISVSQFDSKRLTQETVAEQLNEGIANLNKIVAAGQEQLNEERANLNKIVATGEKQLREEEATLGKIVATGEKLIEEAEATLRKTVRTLSEQINEATATRDETVATLQKQIEEAEANLDRIAEVRPVDVQAARAEVESALAAVDRARADLDMADVKAPVDGQILKIHTRPGEVVGNDGIVDMGQTDQMFVVAEVYESDISKVRAGQRAMITNDSFAGELKGVVAEVGLQISKKDVLDTDPAADVDARVVEVKIRLDKEDSKRVKGLTNLQVEVKIMLGENGVGSGAPQKVDAGAKGPSGASPKVGAGAKK